MNRKSLTRAMVELKASGLSYADVAKYYGVSRQRIQQRFSATLATMEVVADRARALCEECGQFDQFGHFHHKCYDFDILNEPDNILYLCNSCHLHLNGEKHYCRNCGKIIPSRKRYCNPECRRAFFSVVCECTNCHKSFTLNASQKIRIRLSQTGWLFCSKKCQGVWIAKYFGFQKGHCRGHKGFRKYDEKLILDTQRETGYGALRLSRLLHIPVGTIGVYLKRSRESLKERNGKIKNDR